MHKLLFSAVSALALSACNGVPLTTQWTLRSYSIASADIAPLRLAVRAPDWLEATPDNGKVAVSYWQAETPDEKRSLAIRVKRAAHDQDAAKLAELAGGSAGRLTVFEADRRDLAGIRAAQDEAGRWKRDGVKSGGALTLDGALYCRRGDIPQGPILFDVFIHTDDETGWLPLLAGYDVHGPGADEKKLEESLPPCPKSTARIGAGKGGK